MVLAAAVVDVRVCVCVTSVKMRLNELVKEVSSKFALITLFMIYTLLYSVSQSDPFEYFTFTLANGSVRFNFGLFIS